MGHDALTYAECDTVRSIILRVGAVRASELLGVARQSALRCAAALPVRRGTALVVRRALADLAEIEATP